MDYNLSSQKTFFSISNDAKDYITNLLESNHALKISIKKGGCSGHQYVFQYIDKSSVNSALFEEFIINKITFYVEKIGLIYIADSILSYKKTQTGYLLYFENPILSFCGCGKSFKS